METAAGQVAMITGATDGLGKALAKRMAEQGYSLILHGRDQEKGEAVIDELIRETGNKNLLYYNADFSDLYEVRMLADKLLSAHRQLDVLVNNAGIGPGESRERKMSKNGYELVFAVNYLAAFLLTDLLVPLLKNTPGARVIMVASGLQEAIDFADIMLEKDYSGRRAYGRSKVAMIMLAYTLAERLYDTGILINSVHPASLMDTKLVRASRSTPRSRVDDGVDAVWFVANIPREATSNGAYFDGRLQRRAHDQVYSRDARELLWVDSLRLVGL